MTTSSDVAFKVVVWL